MLTFLIINLKSYRKYLILRINIYPLSRRISSQRTFHCGAGKAVPVPLSPAWHLMEAHSGWGWARVCLLNGFLRADWAHEEFSQG